MFTPSMTKLIRFIPSDIGRPISDFAQHFMDQDLLIDFDSVLSTGEPIEREVQSNDNKWFVRRISPYRARKNLIAGLAVTFVDVTKLKLGQKNLLQSEERFRMALSLSPGSIIVAQVDLDLRYTWIYNSHPDFKPDELVGKRDLDVVDNEGTRNLNDLKQRVIDTGVVSEEDIAFPLSDRTMIYRVTAHPMFDAAGEITGVTTAAVDITEFIVHELKPSMGTQTA